MRSRVWLNTDSQFSRRVTARRRVVAGALAAVVVLLGITVAWRTESADDHFVPAGPPHGLDAWRTESVLDRLVPAGPSRGLDALASPIDVGWLPPGFHPPRAALIAPGTYGLQTERDDPPATLTVTTRDTEPTVEGTRTSVAVHGKPATVISVPPPPGDQEGVGLVRTAYRLLIFERTPGTWIQVRAGTSSRDEVGVSVDDLRRIAEGLVDRPRPVPDLVRFADLPDGLEPGTVTSDPAIGAAIGFVGPGYRPRLDPSWSGVITEDAGTRVWVGVGYLQVLGRSVGFTPGSPVRREIRIDGRRVWLVSGTPPDRPGAVVILDGKLGVAVSATGLTDDQLARFAAGIHPGPDL